MSDRTPNTAIYLSNGSIGLRAPVMEDAAVATVWYEGPASHGQDEVEQFLRREQQIPWGGNPVIRLVACRIGAGDVVGGVVVVRSANRTSSITVTSPSDEPERPSTLEGVMSLVVPWLLDEVGVMTVVLETPTDDLAMIRAAEFAGMQVVVRRREHVRRDDGRVDLLLLERVNMDWGHYAS